MEANKKVCFKSIDSYDLNYKWSLRFNRNLTPILVGGTGLYFKSLEEGLAEIPEIL